MPSKIHWIDNLRGIACLMVVMIHTTTWYITNPAAVTSFDWNVANLLNSASRVSVPLFFMISGYLFYGERSAHPRHFLRIGLCLLFYSLIALLYIVLFTSINSDLSLKNILQKPIFYHLWFFFAVIVIYLLSPLIQVKALSLYAILGRAIGMMETQKRALNWLSAAVVVLAVVAISRGTLHELRWRGNFADTWYLYCGPMVFLCAIALFTLVKNTLNSRTLPGLALISRHSLGIYGFHALIIHALRTRGVEVQSWPLLDILWVFSAALAASLALSMLVQRIDRRRFVS